MPLPKPSPESTAQTRVTPPLLPLAAAPAPPLHLHRRAKRLRVCALRPLLGLHWPLRRSPLPVLHRLPLLARLPVRLPLVHVPAQTSSHKHKQARHTSTNKHKQARHTSTNKHVTQAQTSTSHKHKQARHTSTNKHVTQAQTSTSHKHKQSPRAANRRHKEVHARQRRRRECTHWN